MQFIHKKTAPRCWTTKTPSLIARNAPWKNISTTCKKAVHEQIMTEEQGGICIYCEIQIAKNDSHLEHVIPQSTGVNARFDYHNLAVSCNGNLCSFSNIAGMTKKQKKLIHSCGHRKEHYFDALFLNPLQEMQISDYFSYDKSNGKIISSGKSDRRAKYTIKILGLDNYRLNQTRVYAQQALYNTIKAFPLENRGIYLKNILSKPQTCISYLRYYYKSFI